MDDSFCLCRGQRRSNLDGDIEEIDIEAWHEMLGTRTQSVTIGEKESKDIAFSFKA